MMDYLKTVVALFLATAVTAGAVQFDPYEITEEQDDGSTKVVYSFDGVDTSNFSTWQEYKDFLEKEYVTPDSPVAYRLGNQARGKILGHIAYAFQNVILEALNRNVATKAQVFRYQIHNLGQWSGQGRGLSGAKFHFRDFDITHIFTEADLSKVDEPQSLMPWVGLAPVIKQHGSNEAFEAVWTVLENADSIDQNSVEYKMARIEYYHVPKGNTDKAYSGLLSMAQAGNQIPSVLDVALENGRLTDELLEAICRNADPETLKGLDNKLAEYWKNMDWFDIQQNHTDAEIRAMCEKYEAVQRSTAPTFRGVVADTKADHSKE